MTGVSYGNTEQEYGYTTGVYAAAAAKAATLLLLSGSTVDTVNIIMPSGSRSGPIPVSANFIGNMATAEAVKISPEAADATNGLKIVANAVKTDNGISVKAGPGIGKITKRGLQVEPGQPAINPVPLYTITGEVKLAMKQAGYCKGIRITLSVPGGEEAAKHTFNERLGIKGGISILGTTGILRPMSHDSLKISLLKQVDVAAAEGNKRLIMVPGNIGETAARGRLKSEDVPVIQANNLFGEMLAHCKQLKIDSILLLGHIGKLAKLAMGQMNTHSRFNSCAWEAVRDAAKKGSVQIKDLDRCPTLEEAAKYLLAKEPAILDDLAKACSCQSRSFVGYKLRVSTVMTLLDGRIAARHITDSRWEKDLCLT